MCRRRSRSGLKDADSAIWFGVFMPAKTPREIVEKFHAAGAKVLADPAMQASLKQLGVETVPMTPSEIDGLVKRETETNLDADQGRRDHAIGRPLHQNRSGFGRIGPVVQPVV